MPGTPHAPMILFVSPEIEDPERPALRRQTGYVLSSFLQRLSFEVEQLLFSTAQARGARSAKMQGEASHYHFHFMARTLLEDDAGQPFADATAAQRHAEFLAVQLSEGGHLAGSSILVAKDDAVIFEVPLSRVLN